MNDSETLRDHLVWVSKWMIMSTYSTWLLFIQETTSIESFLEGVNVSIGSTFLVSQQFIASSKEEIKCIYRIEISDLQIKQFATWTKGSRLAEFTNVFDEKNKNFEGKIMNIGIYQVSLTRIEPFYLLVTSSSHIIAICFLSKSA